MVDVRYVRQFNHLRRQHRGVKHHVVVLDAGHGQSSMARTGLDADTALSPADHSETIPRESGSQFRSSEQEDGSAFCDSRRSLVRFSLDIK